MLPEPEFKVEWRSPEIEEYYNLLQAGIAKAFAIPADMVDPRLIHLRRCRAIEETQQLIQEAMNLYINNTSMVMLLKDPQK